MHMDACPQYKLGDEGELILRCVLDGQKTELTIPRTVLRNFVWATWAQPTNPVGTAAAIVPVPVEKLGEGTTQDGFVLLLGTRGGWQVPLEIRKEQMPAFRKVVQAMELFFADGPGRA